MTVRTTDLLGRPRALLSSAGGPSEVIVIHPQRLPGRWRDGYALDVHTVSSTYLGDDQGQAADVFALTITRTRSKH